MNSPLVQSLRNMLREAFEGPVDPKETWFTNNEPSSGILGVLEELSADEASLFVHGTTVAAHANHVRYHMYGTNRLIKTGEYPAMDWVLSWATTSVSGERWKEIQEELRSEYRTLVNALDVIEWNERLGNEVLASLAHSAYHLGAIRQMVKVIKHDNVHRTDGLSGHIQIEPLSANDEGWLSDLWQAEWGGNIMVSRGRVYRLSDLKALVAKSDGALFGAATYRFDDAGGCELMTINAVIQGGGVGTKLLTAVEEEARNARCHRIWLITTNDNLDALRFYQRRGYRITAVYPGAVDEARRIKPTIPFVSGHGIEVHDEIELAKALREMNPAANVLFNNAPSP